MTARGAADDVVANELLVNAADLPRHEVERLLGAASGLTRPQIATAVIDSEAIARFHSYVERRRAGEPLQYIEGTLQFGPVNLAVDRRALIPRPETEQMWEMAAASIGEAGPGNVIVDLATGSGNLALALKHTFPAARVLATDSSEDALSLAKENSASLDLDVTYLHGDLFAALPPSIRGRVDLLVCNPPYVADEDFTDLPGEVRDWEPRLALAAGPAGTEFVQRMGDEAYWWLAVGGWVFCEIGESQAADALASFAGLDREVRQDATGRDRFLVGRRGAPCCV